MPQGDSVIWSSGDEDGAGRIGVVGDRGHSQGKGAKRRWARQLSLLAGHSGYFFKSLGAGRGWEKWYLSGHEHKRVEYAASPQERL